MNEQPPPPVRRTRARIAFLILAALAGAVALLVVVLHIPYVRGRVLGYILPAVERAYQLRLTASRLDYNLAAMRVGLADLALAAPHTPYESFFEADYVEVDVPWSILWREIVFDQIAVTNGELTIRRYADGTTNLPPGSDEPGGEPAPLRINRLAIDRLAVDLNDEQAITNLWLPRVAILLTSDSGHIRLDRQGWLRTELQETAIEELAGGARFDGRALHLTKLGLRTRDVSASVDGALTLISQEPSLDIAVVGTADAMRVSRWLIANGDLPAGTIAFDAEVEGPLVQLTTNASVMSERLRWRDVVVTDLRGDARITTTEATVDRFGFNFADGEVTGTGVIPLEETGAGRLSGSWKGIDATAATRALAADAAVSPAGAFSGELNVEGTGLDFAMWRGLVRFALAGGTTRRGVIPAPGSSMVRLTEGAWRLEGNHLVGGVAPAKVIASGRTDSDRVNADVTVAHTDLLALTSMLRSAGLADITTDAVGGGSLEAMVHAEGPVADPVAKVEFAIVNFTASEVSLPRLQGVVSGRPALPELTLRADAPEGLVAGEEVADLRAAGRFVGSTVMLHDVIARQPATAGLLHASGTYNIDTGQYDAKLEGSTWRLSPTADRPLAAEVDVAFTGAGNVDAPAGSGRLIVREAEWDGRRIGSLSADVVLENGDAIVTAEAPDFDATADARVTLKAPYAIVADLRARGLDLARLLEGIETPVPISGTAAVTIHAEGPLETWRSGTASVEVQQLDARAGDLAVRLADAAVARYVAERLYVDRLEVDIEDLRLSASGDIDAFAGGSGASGLLVTLTGNVDQVVRAAAAAGLTDLPVTGGTGPVALLARVTGTAEAPTIAADLEAGPGTVTLRDLPSATDLRIRAHAENDWIELREAHVAYEGSRVEATGRAPASFLAAGPAGLASSGRAGPALRTEPAEFHARATNLNPAVLAPFVEPGTLDEVDGVIDASLDLSTPTLELADLTGELRIDRLDVRVADLPITQRVPTRVVARDGFARVEAWEWLGQGAALDIRGQVRLEDRQAAILANGVVDLRMLTPFVRDAGMTTAGRLEPRLSITGAVESPRIDGDIVLSNGEVRLVEPRVIVSDLETRMVLSRMTGRISQLTGTINGGTLTGEGSVNYNDDGQLALELTSDVRGMALEFPEGLRSELDANLGIALQTPEPMAGRISGTVTVVRGAYREPLAVVTGLLAGARARQLAAATQPSPLLDALALDVRVITDEDIFVDNNYGRFQLGGDLRVIGTAAAPALSGRAELREGGQLFVGRNVYTLNFGAIDFANPTAIEPILAVEASTRAGGEDIDVAITGPAEGPSVVLTSPTNPELGQAELASLLLTGRRLEDLAPGDAAFVGTQVLGNFSAEVLGFASRAVGLDTVRLGGVDNPTSRRDPTTAATELDPTTRVTFGKSIGSNVDVTFSQSLRDGDAQTWIVDYLPRRGLDLRLVSDDEDLRSYGFRHDVSFGNPPRATQDTVVRRRADLRVSRIDLTGALALPEARIRDELRLEVGDSFDFASWQEDRDRLEALYRRERYLIARIDARRVDEANGVVLAYGIAAGPLATIEITGMEVGADTRERLDTAWTQSVFDAFLIDEVAGIVRADLASRGYLQPTVTATIRDEPGAKVLAIVVEQGSRTTQTVVRVEGAGDLTADIEAHLSAADVIDGTVIDPGRVEDSVTAYLRERGYVQAVVNAGAPRFEDATATVPLIVEAGDVFVVREVHFEGADGLDLSLLTDAADIEPGTPYVTVFVEEARQRLVSLYRGEGFAAAAVATRPAVDQETARVSLTFEIVAGPRQTVGAIVVEGNRGVDTDVIHRSLDLAEGAPLRSADVLQARTRVFNTGLFRRIDVASEPIESAGTNTATPMRLRVTVEEWPAVRLRYGVVVAEERPEDRLEGRELVPGVSADVTRRMLFGRPIGVGTAVSLQRRDQRGRVFVNTPTLFSLPVESSLIGEASRETFSSVSLVTDRRKITWEQRARVWSRLDLSYSYTFERNHTFDTNPNELEEFVFDLTVNIARVNGAASWDTRDDPTDTSRGLFASATTEFAPEAVGSDIRFIRQLQQAYYFRPWKGMVFASAARYGIVVPLEGQDLIVSERFFAGGSRTVRGVAEESLGGRDFFGDPTGGQVMLVLNQEVRVPIYRWLRGVGFVDAGNVFAKPRDTRLGDLVGSVGAGLRLTTPFALLRMDFAKTAWGAPGTSGRWTFGIGHAF